jgi:rhodanese-related sulfurtransferase
MKRIFTLLTIVILLITLNSCDTETQNPSNDKNTSDLQTNVMQVNTFEISPTEVNQKLTENQEFHLIDVRTPEENAEIKIPNSQLMVLDNLAEMIINNEDIAFNDEIIVYCRSGNRSKTAYDILTQLGYTNVKSMAGGINEWTDLGYNTCSELNNNC